MYRLSCVEPRSDEVEDWRRAAAGICLDVGATMVGLGLLYWGLIVAHATSLSSRWFLGLYDAADPLASLGDPFMWAVWSVYWFLAVELVVRGVRERGADGTGRRGDRSLGARGS